MAKFTVAHKTLTPTATANATNLVDSTYPFAILGGSSTQRINILEVLVTGQAGSSTPTFMVFGRDSQVATGALTSDATLTAAANDPASAALAAPPSVFNLAATNKPQRSASLGTLLNLSINAYGGLVRWVPPPGNEIVLLGNTASFGQLSLSAFTGGTPGLIGAHMVYEPF